MSNRLTGTFGWREPILQHFTPQISASARLTIVDDPDQLLADQLIADAVRQAGFDLVTYEDPVAFRFLYEGRYRNAWDNGEGPALVVLLRGDGTSPERLPFDVLSAARVNHRILRFGLGTMFPQLSHTVVAELDRADLDAVFEAVSRANLPSLGERSSRDFILKHVYDADPATTRTAAELLRMLLRRHYRNRQLPAPLDRHLIDVLRENAVFDEWPLDQIVPDRAAFLTFLQERWPIFVRRQRPRASPGPGDTGDEWRLQFGGPADIPFDHDDVRVYIDNLFVEGLLTPTAVVPKETVAGTWLEWGVGDNAAEHAAARFGRMSAALGAAIPAPDAHYRTWLSFAVRWFEWLALLTEMESERSADPHVVQLWNQVDAEFSAWMLTHYGSLHNLAYLPKPVMVHHTAWYAAHTAHGAPSRSRVAVIVMDGMSGVQWVPLRKSLSITASGGSMDESAVFAWVPTITPVSRQSIFAGELPYYFPQSIGTTAKDENHWRRFWESRGLRGHDVQFVAPRAMEDETSLISRIRLAAERQSCTALAATVPFIDTMAHGAVTGARGLQAQVNHWAREGHFRNIVEALLERRFTVHITSDHGNIECKGMGRPNVGVLADQRGERVHLFREQAVRDQVHTAFPNSLPWPSPGLPDGYLPLLALERQAFTTAGRRTISHGGISVEEVIVPFVTIQAPR